MIAVAVRLQQKNQKQNNTEYTQKQCTNYFQINMTKVTGRVMKSTSDNAREQNDSHECIHNTDETI